LRLWIISDIHLEHAPFSPPSVDADLVILAGDTAQGADGIGWAREHLDGLPVLYIAGNHEFYGEDFPGLIDRLRESAQGSSVHVLENDQIIIGGIRFLGCSMWSDFDFAGAEHRARTMELCGRLVNDYKQISRSDLDRPLEPQDTRDAHLVSRSWLSDRLAESHDGPTVVVTHHSPVTREPPPNRILAAIGGAFATDLRELMSPEAVDLWVFGHIHRCIDTSVNGTRLISNQRGYPHEPVAGFDPGLVIDL
jgi:predicted phosphodiesterase